MSENVFFNPGQAIASDFELSLKMGAYCEYVLKLASKKAGK